MPSTTATAATSGEAIAGTDTTKFITPSLLPAATSYHAGPVVNGRAPRQGLVFDGTAGATGTAVTIVTADLTFSQWVRVPSTVSATRGLFLFSPAGSIGATSLLGYVDSDATLNIHITGATSGDRTKQTLSGFVTAYAGKWVNILFTRVGSTWTGYINGVATTFSASTSGTAPTWAGSISGAVVNFGSLGSSGAIYNDAISATLIYNRALSASEVVSLYESGAPSAADYNLATNTNQATSTVNASGGSLTGASATGFTMTSASGVIYVATRPAFGATSTGLAGIYPIGSRWLVTFTATLTSGATPSLAMMQTNSYAAISNTQSIVAGSNSIVLTTTAAGTWVVAPTFYTVGASTYTIANITVTPLGLLLAPDAAQAGNGYVWNDQSGNLAQIVLPSSGVAWNLPSVAGNRIRGTTNTNGNQQLLGASTLLPAECQITHVRARARSGTPTITIGTASGGAQIVASVALSTTWLNCTIALTGGIVSSADDIWVGSNSTDVVETDIAFQPLDF